MKSKNLLLVISAITLVFAMTAIGCDNDPAGPKPIKFVSSDSSGNTYTLTITPETADTVAEGDSYELTISNGSSSQVSKGTITNITNGVLTMKPKNEGSETFTVTMDGEQMSKIEGKIAVEGGGEALDAPGELTPTAIAVTLNSVNANGSATQTTTQLTLTFDKAITGLTADDITLTGITVTKGTVSNSGTSYTLPISGFTAGGTLNVAVAKSGYTISGSPKEVTIYFYSGSGGGDTGDFTYTETGTAVTITGYTGSATSVTIPAQINGKPVTTIGGMIFGTNGQTANTKITSVTIPDSVTTIGEGAFINCTSLTSVTIGSGVTSIESFAFSKCSSLATITIPESVISVWQKAFDETAWLNSKSDGVVYAGKVAYVYKGTMPANTSITLQDGTKGIAQFAFDTNNLTSITIPASVISIMQSAFGMNYNGITSVTFQGTIPSSGFSTYVTINGLRSKFYETDTTNGTPGTYTRSGTSGSYTWTKQD
jgi:hypothetical protein